MIKYEVKKKMHFFLFTEFDYGYYLYKFVIIQQEWLSWPDAEIYCHEVESGHLLSISGPRENSVILKHTQALRRTYGYSRLWIGANDFQSVGQFRWIDGSPFNYTRWARGQPTRNRVDADCVSTTIYPYSGNWYADNCLYQKPFACKIKSKKIVSIDISLSSRGNLSFLRSQEIKCRIYYNLTLVDNQHQHNYHYHCPLHQQHLHYYLDHYHHSP